MKPLINTNKHELLYKDEVYNIVGCAMEVLNILGNGLLEKPYENAFVEELKIKKIPFQQQKKFKVSYKSAIVGEYIPDLIVYDKIIIEIKVIDSISNIERAQVLNYLKITGLKLGIILNFKKSLLEWERIIL